MSDILGVVVMAFGGLLTVFGILGTWILPELLMRMHAATKCGVTGAATIIMGLMLISDQWGTILKLGVITVFIFATAPLVAHIVAVGSFSEQEDKS